LEQAVIVIEEFDALRSGFDDGAEECFLGALDGFGAGLIGDIEGATERADDVAGRVALGFDHGAELAAGEGLEVGDASSGEGISMGGETREAFVLGLEEFLKRHAHDLAWGEAEAGEAGALGGREAELGVGGPDDGGDFGGQLMEPIGGDVGREGG
jgi:hypothetical protein